jgi:hypothetical protein
LQFGDENVTNPTWGHRKELWDKAKKETQTVLEKTAKAKSRPIFYGELSRNIFAINFQPDGHDFHGLLGQLSEESDQEGKGLISALVVHKEDERPGNGFFTLAQELGRDISDKEKCWIAELARVYRSYA